MPKKENHSAACLFNQFYTFNWRYGNTLKWSRKAITHTAEARAQIQIQTLVKNKMGLNFS